MVIHLEIDWPQAAPRTVSLEASPLVTVGRDAHCTLRLPHPTVSRRHAELRVVGDTVQLRDLGSSSGTFIDESRVSDEWTLIKPGVNAWLGDIALRVLAVGVDDPDASMTLLLTTVSRRPTKRTEPGTDVGLEPETTPLPPCRLHLQRANNATAVTLHGPYPAQVGSDRIDTTLWPDLENDLPIDVFDSLTGSVGIVSASGFLLNEHDPPRQLGSTFLWLERVEAPLLESIIAPREQVRGVSVGSEPSETPPGTADPSDAKGSAGGQRDADSKQTPRNRPGQETQAPAVIRGARDTKTVDSNVNGAPNDRNPTSENAETANTTELGIIEGLRADPVGRAILGVALMVLLLGVALMFFVL